MPAGQNLCVHLLRIETGSLLTSNKPAANPQVTTDSLELSRTLILTLSLTLILTLSLTVIPSLRLGPLEVTVEPVSPCNMVELTGVLLLLIVELMPLEVLVPLPLWVLVLPVLLVAVTSSAPVW